MAERDVTRLSQQQFGSQALGYSKSRVFYAGSDLDVIISMASNVKTNFAADIGSGAGFTAFGISPFASTVFAIDLALPMLQYSIEGTTSRGLTNVVSVLGSAESLPFPNNSLGLVTCRLAAHHFNDIVVATREFARVLKSEGLLILVDTVVPEEPEAAAWMNNIELRRDPSHSCDLSVQQWLDVLTTNGFTIQETLSMTIPLEFEDWTQRSGTPRAVVEGLRTDFINATNIVTDAFDIQPDEPLRFSWPCLALKARVAG